MSLQAVRCRHHPGREAVARCPECGQFFCRECINEQGERVLCAACLAAGLTAAIPRRRLRAALLPAVAATGVVLLWGLFYYLGKALLLLPSAFHDGTIWNRF